MLRRNQHVLIKYEARDNPPTWLFVGVLLKFYHPFGEKHGNHNLVCKRSHIIKKFVIPAKIDTLKERIKTMAQTFTVIRLVLFWKELQNDLSRFRQRIPKPLWKPVMSAYIWSGAVMKYICWALRSASSGGALEPKGSIIQKSTQIWRLLKVRLRFWYSNSFYSPGGAHRFIRTRRDHVHISSQSPPKVRTAGSYFNGIVPVIHM